MAGMTKMTERILIVDDDECLRETLCFVLGQAGFQCLGVPGGEQALRLLTSGERFDLVTTDITNAPMDGITFLEQITNRFPDIPVLMITAHNGDSTALVCRRKGAVGYLLKPCEREQLMEAVSDALKARRHRIN